MNTNSLSPPTSTPHLSSVECFHRVFVPSSNESVGALVAFGHLFKFEQDGTCIGFRLFRLRVDVIMFQ